MAYRIEFSPAARREFKSLPPQVKPRLQLCIEALSEQPRPNGCKKLKGDENLWRIRVGDYRVIYEVHGQVLLVVVITVGNRRDVYR